MRKFTLFLALMFFIGMQVLQAQTRAITGTVTNAGDGSTIPGVSVVVKGTTFGTTTDLNGKYSLNVPPDALALRFSFIGMNAVERNIAGITVLNVSLEPTATAIEGVVVTALGISREKKSLGYATQELSGEELNQVKRNDFLGNLSGKAAGVQVKTNNNLGGSTNVIIRGNASITGNNQALIVVDGIPINNANTNNAGQLSGRAGYDYGNAAADIDPNNIESMNVLKGAAATALYGSRAANGVIMITTKKGQKAAGASRILGVSISSNVTTGFIDKSTFPAYQKGYGGGYGPLYSDGDYPGLEQRTVFGEPNSLVVPTYEDASMGEKFDPNLMVYQFESFYPESPFYKQKTPWIYGGGGDGPIDFFETPWSFNNNIDITGGGDISTFRLSYTNTDQNGIMPNSSLKKNNFLFNGTYDVLENVKVTASANYINTKGKGRNSTGYSDNILSSFRQWYQVNANMGLLKDLYDATGKNISWNPKSEDNLQPAYWDNPYWVRYQNYESDNRDRLIAYSQIDWKITDYLSIMGRGSIDTYDEMQEERKAMGSVSGELGVQRSEVTSGYSRFSRKFRETNFDLIANFNKYLTDDLSLNALLGTNIRRTTVDQVFASTDGGLVIPDLYALSNSANPMLPPEERYEKVGVNGIFAGVSLGYADLVYLDATIRRDESSTLPADNRDYYYPAVSGSFLFGNLLENATWMQLGKLRLGYAQIGNDAPWGSTLDTYTNVGLYSLFGTTALFSVPSTKNNAELKPERTTSLEGGLEMIFLQNRLGFDLSLYKNNSVDLIMPVSVSFATGYSGKYVNAGDLQNKGVELTLRGAPVVTNDFRWDATLNYARNRSEVISLDEGLENLQIAALQGGVTINARVGEPYGTIQGTDFVYSDKGEKVVGANGHFRKSATSDKIIGNISPDWTAGFNNNFTYKGWSFSFLLEMQQGGSIFSTDLWYGMATGLYEETVFINDLGNSSRAPISEGGGFINKGVVNVGTDDNPIYETNTKRIAGDTYSAFGYATSPNGRYVYDATYIKLREAVLTYTLPKTKLAKTPLQGVSFSLVGSNLWIISKDLIHADPEASQSSGNVQGWQSGVMPTTRNVGLTVNLQF